MKSRSAAIVSDFVESITQLTEILRNIDFVTRFITFRDEDKALKTLHNPIIFIPYSDNKNLIQQRIRDLIQNTELHKYPIVAIGPDIVFFEQIISGFIHHSACVNTPYNENTIKKALDAIISQEKYLEENDFNNRQLPSNFCDIFGKGQIFKQIQNKELGGKSYLNASDPESFLDKSYLSNDENIKSHFKTIINKADAWELGHIHRCSYLAYSILKTLGFNDKNVESARIAANLYCTTLVENHRYMRSELLTNKDKNLLDEISQELRKCAKILRQEIKDEEVSNIIEDMSDIICGNKPQHLNATSLAASIIIAADITDRACWQNGSWDPNSAHKILLKARDESFFSLPADVVACILKFILEAIDATSPKRMVNKTISNNETLKDFANINSDIELKKGERKINLTQLSPGMVLKKPIMAFDGKVIAPKDIVLDSDIIWRIWCLSSVRPINTPLIVAE